MKEKTGSISSLGDDISRLYEKLREQKFKKWDRVLPLNELLIDRWEKAKFLKAKTGASIYDNSYVYGDVAIGKSTWIGPYTILDGSGAKLSIGNFCSISAGVQIYTHNTVDWALTGGKSKYKSNKVRIGSSCYIGPNSIISMGSTIGSHSIIGAQSMIDSKVPSNSVVFGTPGRIVGRVKILDKHTKIQYFDKPKNLKRV